MPGSYTFGKNEIKEIIFKNIEKDKKVLDVGPGIGTYGKLLNADYIVDCIEIFPEYIDKYNLKDIYNKVIIGDICDFNYDEYELIIMGDVLEHIDVNRATKLITDINSKNKKLVIVVPYLYEQGPWGGNVFETHLQSDLTPEVMKERYPSLIPCIDYNECGYYTNFKI